MAEPLSPDGRAPEIPDSVPVVARGFTDAITRGTSVTEAFAAAVRSFGFETFTFGMTTVAHASRESRFYVWTNAPREWLVEYDRCAFIEVDPRISTAQLRSAPFLWDRFSFPNTTAVSNFFDAAARHGICSGVVIRLYDPNHARSAISYNTSVPRLDDTERARIMDVLSDLMVFSRFVNAYLLVEIANRKVPPMMQGAPLSPRERECLQWSARGMTSAMIAEQLGIGERTVHYHVANLLSKLGAANRQEAIARATAAGLIQP